MASFWTKIPSHLFSQPVQERFINVQFLRQSFHQGLGWWDLAVALLHQVLCRHLQLFSEISKGTELFGASSTDVGDYWGRPDLAILLRNAEKSRRSGCPSFPVRGFEWFRGQSGFVSGIEGTMDNNGAAIAAMRLAENYG
jgi:hypothetical protein